MTTEHEELLARLAKLAQLLSSVSGDATSVVIVLNAAAATIRDLEARLETERTARKEAEQSAPCSPHPSRTKEPTMNEQTT